MKVEALRQGNGLTPQQVLSEVLGEVDELDGVWIVQRWEDGTYSLTWSTTTCSQSLMAAGILFERALAMIREQRTGEPDPDIGHPDEP